MHLKNQWWVQSPFPSRDPSRDHRRRGTLSKETANLATLRYLQTSHLAPRASPIHLGSRVINLLQMFSCNLQSETITRLNRPTKIVNISLIMKLCDFTNAVMLRLFDPRRRDSCRPKPDNSGMLCYNDFNSDVEDYHQSCTEDYYNAAYCAYEDLHHSGVKENMNAYSRASSKVSWDSGSRCGPPVFRKSWA